MARGKIIGEVNLPTKTALYTGLETDSAYTTVNNEEKTISVDLKESFVTDRVVLADANQEIAGYKNFTDHLMVTGAVSSDLIPSGNGDHNLGSYEHSWGDFYINGAINKNTDGFGFKLPSSGALNSNSYLATDYDIDMLENDISNISSEVTSLNYEKADKSNTVTTDTDQTISGLKTFDSSVKFTDTVTFDSNVDFKDNSKFYQATTFEDFESCPVKINFDSFSSSFLTVWEQSTDSHAYFRFNDELSNDRTISFQNKSGTVALTSDLNNLVTLNTNQTITGVKTFSEELNLGGNPGLGMLGLYNQETHRYDYLVGGSDGGDFQIPSIGKLAVEYLTVPHVMSKWDNQYGLELPDSEEWTSNKTIATTDDLTGFVHLGTSSSPSNEDIYGAKTFKSSSLPYEYANEVGASQIEFKYTNIYLQNTATYAFNGINLNGINTHITLENSYGQYFSIYDDSGESGKFAIAQRPNSSNTYYNYLPNKTGTLATTDDCGTKLYRHHFDIILQTTDLPTIPNGYHVSININALSTSGEEWETLSELDGGGFIISAFGLINDSQGVPADYNHIFELKIFYSSVGNGTLLLNVNDLTDNSVKAVAITTVFGGQTPNTYQIEDSVTPL